MTLKSSHALTSRSIAFALLLWANTASSAEDGTEATRAASRPILVAQANATDARPPAAAREDPWAGVEEMIVTSQTSSLLEGMSAVSITAFDQAELVAMGASDIGDIADFTPNLDIRSTSASSPTFFIRGVGLSDFNANASGSVAIYRDGVPIQSPATQLGLIYDVDGVVVLNGPQGTGPALNASAGMIAIDAKRPTGVHEAYFRSSYGNYDAVDVEGALELPVLADVLAARFSFRFSDRDGYGTNRCAGLPPFSERPVKTAGSLTSGNYCGESFPPLNPALGLTGISHVSPGLAKNTNDRHVWSTRGVVRYRPDFLELDSTTIGSYLRRDETSPVGIALGTGGTAILPPVGLSGPRIRILGTQDQQGYIDPDVARLERAYFESASQEIPSPVRLPGETNAEFRQRQSLVNRQRLSKSAFALADRLAERLEPFAYEGDYNGIGPNRIETWSVSNNVKARVQDFDVEAIIGGQRYERTNYSDADFTPNQLFESRTEDEAWQASGQLSISREITDDFSVEVGGFFLREKLDVEIANFVQSQSTVQNTGRRYNQDSRHYFVYGEYRYRFWEAFEFAGGVRFNGSRIKFNYELDAPSGRLSRNEEKEWDSPTGEIQLSYDFSAESSMYLKFARGWRGGKYNASANTLKALSSVDPESVDAWETGFKSSWWDDRVTFLSSFFFYCYKNYQVFIVEADQGSPPEIETVNARKAQIYGAEMELRLNPIDSLNLTTRVGWLESKFLDFKNDRLKSVEISQTPSIVETVPIPIDFTGNRLPNSPRFKVTLIADYTVELGKMGRLTPRYDAVWSDDVYFDPTESIGTEPNEVYLPKGSIGQPAYWLHNFRLTYATADGHIEVAGWVRNMTNELYKTFGFDASLIQATTINFLGEPRTYGMDVRLAW